VYIIVESDKKYKYKVHLKKKNKFIGTAKCSDDNQIQKQIDYLFKIFGNMDIDYI